MNFHFGLHRCQVLFFVLSKFCGYMSRSLSEKQNCSVKKFECLISPDEFREVAKFKQCCTMPVLANPSELRCCRLE